LMLAYRVIAGSAPTYLNALVRENVTPRMLRSSSERRLALLSVQILICSSTQWRYYRGCSRCGYTWARGSWGPVVVGHRHIYINLNSLKREYVHGGRGHGGCG